MKHITLNDVLAMKHATLNDVLEKLFNEEDGDADNSVVLDLDVVKAMANAIFDITFKEAAADSSKANKKKVKECLNDTFKIIHGIDILD